MTTDEHLTRVAVDAMGGDYAPAETVAGAVEAARHDGVAIVLVGDPEAVESGGWRSTTPASCLSRRWPSEGVVAEGEPPALALRQKPRASVIVATGLVKGGTCGRVRNHGFHRRGLWPRPPCSWA